MSGFLTTLLNALLIVVFALSVFIERGVMRDVQQHRQSPEMILNAPNPEFFRPENNPNRQSETPTAALRPNSEWLNNITQISGEAFAWLVTRVLQSGYALEAAVTPPAFRPQQATGHQPGGISFGRSDIPTYAQEPLVDLSL